MNLGISLLRCPTPELVATIVDESKPMRERWHAYCLADGFDPADYPYDECGNGYVQGEIARVCKALKEAKPSQ